MKYCNACGTQMPDDAAFCPNCGAIQNASAAPVEGAVPPVENAAPVYDSAAPVYDAYNTGAYANPYEVPAKKSKKGLIIALASSIAAVLIIAIVVIVILLSGRRGASSQKDLANGLIKALNKQDEKALMNLMPDFMESKYRSQILYGNIFDNYPYRGYTLTLGETSDLKIFDRDDIIDMENDIYRETGDRVVIDDGCEVEYYVEISQPDYNYSTTERIELECIKMNGRWYLVDMDM